jgi:hypothetical protein
VDVRRLDCILRHKDEATYIKAVTTNRKEKEENVSAFGNCKVK